MAQKGVDELNNGDELASLGERLQSWAASRGVSLLAVPRNLVGGFESVTVRRDPRFYGILPEFDHQQASLAPSACELREAGLVTDDLEDRYLERALRIAADMRLRSRQEGFDFYNGRLAKLTGFSVEDGMSANSVALSLDVCTTSYFTALGTNVHFEGYDYVHSARRPEDALPAGLSWANSDRLGVRLATSPLANQLAVHLVVYNDDEILYVKRGKVGQQVGMSNSTVNGAMEFKTKRPDERDGVPELRLTAMREAEYELGIHIRPEEIRWLGLVATHRRSEPAVVGVCHVGLSRKEVDSACRNAEEAFEVQREGKRLAKRCVRSFRLESKVVKQDFSVLCLGSQTLPILRLATPIGPFRRQLADADTWTAEGAVAFVLCLAHLHEEDWIRSKVLQTPRR